MKYELVSGLETHIELSTKTKIFCGCTTEFGGEPNTHCCPVCIGLPGTLPKLNEQVVNFAIKAGLATNCEISLISKMDRKNYVYPDLPKAYQISQFDLPLCKNGYVELSSGKRIRLNRIHIEEDAGKLVHQRGDVFVDYNRGGVPLIEIVTEPDFRSVEEILEYIERLQLTMKYIGISDCKMQEGSMRCDVNISVRLAGSEKLGTRTEIKNMNSITYIGKAVEYEFARQCEVLDEGGTITQETLRYNEEDNTTSSARDKEDAQDYRYFKEPDIVPIITSQEKINAIYSSLPENPYVRMERYEKELGLVPEDAKNIVKYKKIADFFEKSIDGIKTPKIGANLIISSLFRKLSSDNEKENFNIELNPKFFYELLKLQDDKKISANQSRATFEKMLVDNKSPMAFLSEADMSSVDDSAVIEMCREAVEQNPLSVADYLSGKEKAIQVLIGYVMKKSKGKSNAALVKSTILDMISK